MKKRLASLALIGMTMALSSEESTHSTKMTNTDENQATDPNNENIGYHIFTEDELLLNLNSISRTRYENLSPEGKALALQIASGRCNGTNACKGLNACQTDKNECAGQGSCKGTGKCAFSDKNLAVKLAAKKMAEKREKTLP